MKYLIPLVALLTGCAAPPSIIPERITASGIDFSAYASEGFLFTPNKYGGDYESIGLVQISYTPKAVFVKTEVRGINGQAFTRSSWMAEPIDTDKALQKLYELCLEMGADALTEMQIKNITERHAQRTIHPLTLSGIEISGFAIKRVKE